MKHHYEVTIREGHLDTFGHVNNATYLAIFEEARWELLNEKGYTMEVIQKTGLGPVILEINLKFLRELRLRQNIKIESELMSYNGLIAKMRQVMIDEQGKDCCSAEFTFGLFDLNKRKLVPPTEDWLRAIE